jgi:hypothetical protein
MRHDYSNFIRDMQDRQSVFGVTLNASRRGERYPVLRRHHVVLAENVVDFHDGGLAVLLKPANHQLKIIDER